MFLLFSAAVSIGLLWLLLLIFTATDDGRNSLMLSGYVFLGSFVVNLITLPIYQTLGIQDSSVLKFSIHAITVLLLIRLICRTEWITSLIICSIFYGVTVALSIFLA